MALTIIVAQLLLQAPQFMASAAVFVSQPLGAMLSQLAYPALHAPSTQAPLTHEFVALGKLQAELQVPQLLTLVFVSISQPSAGIMLQSRYAPKHDAIEHVPATQASFELARLQGELHAPQ